MPNHHTFERKETLAKFDVRKGILVKTKSRMKNQNSSAVLYCRVSSKTQVKEGN